MFYSISHNLSFFSYFGLNLLHFDAIIFSFPLAFMALKLEMKFKNENLFAYCVYLFFLFLFLLFS